MFATLNEPVCEDCGELLTSSGIPMTANGDVVVADEKSAGRVDNPPQ